MNKLLLSLSLIILGLANHVALSSEALVELTLKNATEVPVAFSITKSDGTVVNYGSLASDSATHLNLLPNIYFLKYPVRTQSGMPTWRSRQLVLSHAKEYEIRPRDL